MPCVGFAQINLGSYDALNFKTSIINNETNQQKNLAQKLKALYSNNIVNYYKTVLEGTESGAILITNGLNDTYALKILQSTTGLRSDVHVVSLKLLKEEKKYRDRVFKTYGLAINDDLKFVSNYLAYLLSIKGERIFISATVSPNTYKAYQGRLFTVGLVLEHNSHNQFQKLDFFWSNLREKETYKFNLLAEDKGVYSNYLVPLLTLYKLKIQTGQLDAELKKAILYISNVLDKKETVTRIIQKYEFRS
jgi:hypothetical protein